jgi:hypothetical protein
MGAVGLGGLSKMSNEEIAFKRRACQLPVMSRPYSLKHRSSPRLHCQPPHNRKYSASAELLNPSYRRLEIHIAQLKNEPSALIDKKKQNSKLSTIASQTAHAWREQDHKRHPGMAKLAFLSATRHPHTCREMGVYV